jgi:hypothetical protein
MTTLDPLLRLWFRGFSDAVSNEICSKVADTPRIEALNCIMSFNSRQQAQVLFTLPLENLPGS